MNPIIRGVALYVFLLIVFRFAGKRTLAEISTFDALLLLIISEATQQGMLGNDYSLTNAFLLIFSLVGCDIILNKIKGRWPRFDEAAESLPIL